MIFRSLALCFLILFSAVSFAQGRKPAVEDFVGIEVEESKVAPQGIESLYNLEQDIERIEAQKNNPQKRPEVTKEASFEWSVSTVFTLSMALGLPLIVWFLVMSHLRKKASIESASNIEILEKYRKEREKKSEESVRKVS
jgi:hypothetical protein